jgi:hypothetical protein
MSTLRVALNAKSPRDNSIVGFISSSGSRAEHLPVPLTT